AWNHPLNAGALGVTGSSAANRLAAEADVVLAIGTRLQDFTSASGTLFAPDARFVAINPARHDAIKRGALALAGDAAATLAELDDALPALSPETEWSALAQAAITEWHVAVDAAVRWPDAGLPGDAHVLGTVNRLAGPEATVVCAA